MVNLRMNRCSSLRRINLYYIKPGLQIGGILRQVDRCRNPQLILFPGVYVFPGLGKFCIFPQFHLNKYQVLPVLRNQVDFAKPAVKPIGDDFIMFFPQGYRN